MLNEAEIQQALHAARVVPLDVGNPHGPLGLEQLAGAVAGARRNTAPARPAADRASRRDLGEVECLGPNRRLWTDVLGEPVRSGR